MADAAVQVPPATPACDVGCLWVGKRLSFLEQLCLMSMLRHGADVTLYAYEEVTGVPEGIEVQDASGIVPWDQQYVHRKTGSPSIMADMFRYHLLRKRPGIIWCDADVLFVKPLDPQKPFVFGYEGPARVNNALLGLPPDDPTLSLLLDFTSDPYTVPPWASAADQARMRENPVHIADQPWGTMGPVALTHFLRQTGAIEYAAPREVYHPVAFSDVRDLIMRGRDIGRWITGNTVTVHLYGRGTRRIIDERFDGVPPWHGFLGQQLRAYGINAKEAPLLNEPS